MRAFARKSSLRKSAPLTQCTEPPHGGRFFKGCVQCRAFKVRRTQLHAVHVNGVRDGLGHTFLVDAVGSLLCGFQSGIEGAAREPDGLIEEAEGLRRCAPLFGILAYERMDAVETCALHRRADLVDGSEVHEIGGICGDIAA